MTRRLPRAVLFALICAFPALAQTLEIRGTVSTVAADGQVTITLPEGATVAKGDEVRIEADLPGLGPVAIETRWRVETAGAGTAIAVPDGTPSGEPQTGYAAVIETAAEQGAAQSAAGEAESPPQPEAAAPATAAPQEAVAAQALEIRGTVSAVEANGRVTITLPAGATVAEGDEVRIEAELPGVGPVAIETRWRVEQAGAGSAVALPEGTPSGAPQAGYAAVIETAAAQGVAGEIERPPQQEPAAPEPPAPGKASPEIAEPEIAAPEPAAPATPEAAIPETQCERLTNVPFERMRGENAMWACQAAVSTFPGVPRFEFRLAEAERRRGHYAEALVWYGKASESGLFNATAMIATLYESGVGLPKNAEQAAAWYKKAAAQAHAAADKGDAAAMRLLGFLHARGQGVPQDYAQAVFWDQKAVEKGDALAMSTLAELYYNGLGVARDDLKAVRLWHQAADLGQSTAMHNLGALYDRGSGVTRNPKLAAMWIFRALQLADAGSLQQMRENSGAYSEGFRMELQRLLQTAGVYSGAIDGNFGPATLQAITVLAQQ